MRRLLRNGWVSGELTCARASPWARYAREDLKSKDWWVKIINRVYFLHYGGRSEERSVRRACHADNSVIPPPN